MQDKILNTVAVESKIDLKKVTSTVKLLDDGNTIPFIARYRKEMTGGLDEVQIRQIADFLSFHRNLTQRKDDVIRIIEEQGKLADELAAEIRRADTLTRVEDIYWPFRPKRKTRGSIARAKGLEPLAAYLLSFPAAGNVEKEALKYISEDVSSEGEALQGAKDIIAENISDDAEVRGWIRDYIRRHGVLVSESRDKEAESVYTMYYDYHETVNKLPSHRILAINRGEREEYIKVKIEANEETVHNWLNRRFIKEEAVTAELVRKALADAYKRLIQPAVQRDIRSELTEMAEKQAVVLFSKNLRQLLLQPPIKGKRVLGLDPAYRTGCKLAVVDETGKMLETGVIYPTPPQNKIAEAESVLDRLVQEYGIELIAIGNGTASRETEKFTADFIKKRGLEGILYAIVNEAGASVYSASKLAGHEFPDMDVSQRSAVSIARRLQDPLAELVKIEPRSIGVGQYQHDINTGVLVDKLSGVVEGVVNYVGVDLNTASPSLLSYVAGINSAVAENIVKYRDTEGIFEKRSDLLKVPRLGPKAFEQCAGFLRIPGGKNPLDATAIHPESYLLTEKLLDRMNVMVDEVGNDNMRQRLTGLNITELSRELDAGVPTLKDIVDNLIKPGRDPRDELPPPLFREDLLSIDDLEEGMKLKGTVINVVDFGAFVDIGVKESGLVHISQLADRYIKHPMEVVNVGDQVDVTIMSIDKGRKRIGLSMK